MTDADLPPALRDDLCRLYTSGNPLPVPPEIDEAILFGGRQRLGDSRRNRRWSWVGIAAAACFAIFAVQHLIQPPKPTQIVQNHVESIDSNSQKTTLSGRREDIDGSGRVDILDAFTLAKRIEAGTATSESFDFTGDHRVTREDVDVVAMAAVRLKGGA